MIPCGLLSCMHWNLVTTMLHLSYQYHSPSSFYEMKLCSQVTIDGDSVTQLVIPSPLVETVLKLVHDTSQVVHQGRDKTLSVTRRKFYWRTLRSDAEKFISQCPSCAQVKGNTQPSLIL